MMKRFYYILAASVLLFAGCQNEIDENAAVNPSVFTATIDSGEPATRTLLGAATAAGRDVLWKAGDELIVGGKTYVAGSLTDEGRTATLTPKVATELAQKEGTMYKAYYPASIYSKSGSTVTLTLPDEQTYEAPTAADGNLVVASHLPMYAQSKGTTLQFYNLCAVLNFQLKGTETVTKVVVTSATKKLRGSFEVVADGTGFKAQMLDTPTTAEKTVTLKCVTPFPLNATTPTEFCIALPPADYPQNNLTVEVFGTGSTTTPITTFKNSAATGSQLERSKIYDITKQATNESYVFDVIDPTDLTYEGGTSVEGKVVSYKYTGTNTPANRTAVAWDVEGYYATAADAAAGTNKLSDISATYLNSFTPVSQTGGDAGESVSIEYRADSGTPASGVDPTGGITAKLKSNSGAYVRRGSASSYWNLSNPASGSKSSIKETANTYIVNAPGYYCFPLVMGNGIKNNAKNTVAYRQTNFVNYQGGDLNTSTSSPLLNDQGGTPTSAYVVWEEAKMVTVQNETDWTLPSGCISTSNVTIDGVSKQVYWLNFQITDAIAQGCIVLAVTDGSGTVMWSWTIWVTDYVPQDGRSGYSASSNLADVECTYDAAGNKVTFMPVNLGWVETGTTTGTQYAEASVYVRLRQTGTDNYVVMVVTRPEGNEVTGGHPGHHPTYQWGRKDAMVPASIGTEVISSLSGRTTTYQTRVEMVTLAESIQTPDVMFNEGWNDWCSTEDYGWWCAGNTEGNVDKPTVKTIYDPCPAGYTVPRFNAFLGFLLGSDAASPSRLAGGGNVESTSRLGYYFWSGWRSGTSSPTTGMKTIFLPHSGYRVNTYAKIAPGGTCWYAVPNNRAYSTFFHLDYDLGSPSYLHVWLEVYWGDNKWGLQRNYGHAIRPAREELP